MIEASPKATRAPLIVVAAALALLSPATASACPDCEVGRAARHIFWSHHFATNLLAIASPFALVVLVAVLVDRMDGRSRRRRPACAPVPARREP